MSLRAELVTQCGRLDQVGPAWDSLWRESGDRSLFQSHGWVRAWWTAHGPAEHAKLHIGLCWDGDALRAVIPCATRRHRGVRVLEWAAKECTDYCDALAGPVGQPTRARDALATAWQAVAQGGFRVAYLSHIRPDATVLRLAGLPSFTLRPGRRSDQTMQVRSNGLTGAEWFRTLTKKARNNHLRGKRIIAQTGTVSAGVATGADAAQKLERMIVLKRQWLDTTGQNSRLLDDDARILRSLVACLQEHQALQVFSLDCDGELVAGLISIVDGTQSKTFLSAFDPRFDRASPGSVVLVEQLMWAFDQRLPEVDFLCGAETYKSKFADSSIDLAALVGARTLPGHAALAVGEWLDRLKGPAQEALAKLARLRADPTPGPASS